MLVHVLLPVLLAVVGVLGLVRGVPLIVEGVRRSGDDDGVMRLLEGGRWAITGVALGLIAAGLFTRSSTFTTFGVIFLVEEIYETSTALAIVRWGRSFKPSSATK